MNTLSPLDAAAELAYRENEMSHHAGVTTRIPSGAPLVLVEPVVAVRTILLEHGSGFLYGCCIQASLILGWLLSEQGHTVQVLSCTANEWPHWCVRVGGWMLDPTAGQFGEDDPPLLFRSGSVDDSYDPGGEDPIPLCEEEIVAMLARWVEADADAVPNPLALGRSGAVRPLLELAGLSHLEPRVLRAANSS